MTTKLRLLLDECVQAPLARQIETCSGVLSSEHVDGDHPLGNKSTPDQAIVDYATEENRIIVTVEGRFDENKYPICTHPGIIVLKAFRRHGDERAEVFRRFMLSGQRPKCRHAVTTLTADGFERREKIDGQLKIVTGKFK